MHHALLRQMLKYVRKRDAKPDDDLLKEAFVQEVPCGFQEPSRRAYGLILACTFSTEIVISL